LLKVGTNYKLPDDNSRYVSHQIIESGSPAHLEKNFRPEERGAVLAVINEGLGLNVAWRTFQVGKNTVKRWVKRLGSLKETLLLYALCHQFSQLQIEGDELYTKVAENKPAPLFIVWTMVLMNRAVGRQTNFSAVSRRWSVVTGDG
jgi:transposase